MHPSAIATAFAEARADLLDAARQLAQEQGIISSSFLQHRLRIGYPRAARLMVKLEEEGFDRESGKRKLENQSTFENNDQHKGVAQSIRSRHDWS